MTELTQDNKQHIQRSAEDTLSTFEAIVGAAQNALRGDSGISVESLASINVSTSRKTLGTLGKLSQAFSESYSTLAREPAIARVVVLDEQGKNQTYYICRAMPVNGVANLASYRAPIGRLASLSVGAEFTLPNGKQVEVQEQAHLHPSLVDRVWDSVNTTVRGEGFGPVTIESLLALIRGWPSVEEEEDLLEQLLAQESESVNFIEGVRRGVIIKMGLRDQPILDQYQDEIFRLPLDRRLMLLGAPGTGKTTTLIRRLGQKLDTQFLDEDERRLVEKIGESVGTTHANSWLMFTPTELLKQYLKEAFAREGVPASDHRIRTWADYRRELARNTFGVLKSASGGGTFVLKEAIEIVSEKAFEQPIAWFSEFNSWQKVRYIEDLEQSASGLSENELAEAAALGDHLVSIMAGADGRSLSDLFSGLVAVTDKIRDLVSGMKEKTDSRIRRALKYQLRQDNTFVDQLATFLTELEAEANMEPEDYDDQEGDEEDTELPNTGRAAAVMAYMMAVRSQARAHAGKRRLGKNSRAGKIVEWLGNRLLGNDELTEIGKSLLVQTRLRRFLNPVKRYIEGIPRRYRQYRRTQKKENQWYRPDGFNPSDLHPLELDVILLAILRGSNELLKSRSASRDIDSVAWAPLKPMRDLYRNQVLVDETTDFSPVQIACMASLAQPDLRSFFACGDFNQRLTTWGSRSQTDLAWVFPEMEFKEVTVSYRQSRQLNELARAIIEAVGGADQPMSLPEHVDNEGVAPALVECAGTQDEVVVWLAERIREIERFVGQLPSIAVFVESESQVQPLGEVLNQALLEENTQVVACSQGQVMGHDNDVRVFDVQHIKGLEFEAVFFVGVDRLAIQHPKLFDKYLYVGTTRAATYLGITCEEVLPAAIDILRPLFIENWKIL